MAEHLTPWSASAKYNGSQTNTTLKASPGVGKRLILTWYHFTSKSPSPLSMALLDGSGGTVKIEACPQEYSQSGLAGIRAELTADTLLAVTTLQGAVDHYVNCGGHVEAT